jgi:DNA-binding GntR family transcriptional regulator
VTILPNKGTFVVSPLINDIEEIMEIRMMFELTAFDLACQKNLPALISTIDALQKNTSGDFKTFSTLQKRGEFLQYDREFHRCFFICSANRRLLGFHDVVHSQVELLRVKIFSAENTKIALAAHVEIAQLLQQKKISPAKEALKNHIGQVRHDILTSYKENGQNAGS